MKLRVACLAGALVGSSTLTFITGFAQGTAFTYQGRLNEGGQAANGLYDVRFAVFDASATGGLVAGPVTNAATVASNGLFLVTLDFGPVFDGNARWLEIGVRTNGGTAFITLSPRRELTPAPYAILAGDVSQANTNLARLNVPNTATTATGVPTVTSGFITDATVTRGGSGYTTPPSVTVVDSTGSGAFVTAAISNGTVVSLTVHSAGSGYSASATLVIDPPPSNAYQLFLSTNYFSGINFLTNANNIVSGNGAGLTNLNAWQLTGNSATIAGPNFLGTVDNQPLELDVNGQRALRLEPTATNAAVNVIGGSAANGVGPGVVGATISGGGTLDYNGTPFPNQIDGSYGTIGGGGSNSIGASATYTTIAGGGGNTIQSGALSDAIGGGVFNTISSNAFDSVIAGGNGNTIQASAHGAFIGGGYFNTIQTNDYDSTIGGGAFNVIQGSTLGGGPLASTIGGGENNTIALDSDASTIGGGHNNMIGGAVVVRGVGTIAGGEANTIQTNASFATIGGGTQNTIQTNAADSTIGGGANNSILALAANSTIAGGLNNIVSGSFAAVPGGFQNTAAGQYSFAAGNRAKANHPGAFAWADSQAADFASTANDQFIVRAQGGVGINTSAPQATLHVRGTVAADALRAPGAGINTGTFGFVQRAVSTNVQGNFTTIYSPLTDGDPNAILMVTHNFSADTNSVSKYNTIPVGVFYGAGAGTHWAIYNEDLSTMAPGRAFNVLVIKP